MTTTDKRETAMLNHLAEWYADDARISIEQMAELFDGLVFESITQQYRVNIAIANEYIRTAPNMTSAQRLRIIAELSAAMVANRFRAIA